MAMLTSEQVQEAKQAYDLEVKENNVPTAVSSYINVLEEECKKYKDWWIEDRDQKCAFMTDVETLQAEVDYYRSIIAHEFNRK